MKASKDIAEHYNWGQNCDAWHLFKSDSLSIIQERMPADTEEAFHFHHKSQQFFYILSGIATFEIEDKAVELNTNEGIHIKPNQTHKIKNNNNSDLHFLVISEPKAHGDRVNIGE